MEEEYRASGAGKVFKAPERELTDEEKKQKIDMEKERYLKDPDQEDLSQQVNYSKEIDVESLTNQQKQKEDAKKWKEFDDAVAGAKSKEDLIEAGKIRKRLEGNWVSLATLAGETFIGIGADIFLPSPDPISRGLNYGIGYGTNILAQWLRGEEIKQGRAHAAGAFQAIPFGTAAKGIKGIARATGKGAVGSVVGEQVAVGIDEKRVLTPEEVAYAGAFGGTFGGISKSALDNVDITGLRNTLNRLSKKRQVIVNLDGTLSIADDGIDGSKPLMSKGSGGSKNPRRPKDWSETKLDKWKSKVLLELKDKKTYSGTQYKTIEDIPDLRIPRSAIFRKFKGKSNFSEVEDALYEYEYGALVHRELEGQGSLAGFRPFEGYASRGYLDPEGESWIFRSKGTTRGVKNYQWNKAVAVSKAATKRLEAEKQVLKELDTQLGYVAEITDVPKKEFANITEQSAIEKASREQLQQQIKIQRQELGLEGEALLHDKHLKDLHLEHVVGVLQYPEFLRSTHGMNWILNRKNNHGLAGYHKEPPPIWSVILAGKHNKWFVDTVQDAFATPTRLKNKSGYKKPKLAGKDLGLGTDEGKRLFTYPEVLPNFTEKGSIPGDMIISTWDGTQTWRVPRALAILDFIENKNITRAIIQGTRKNKYKDGLLARIISGEKVDISEQVLVGELMTRAKELGVNETLLRKYWNRADLESKQEILWLLQKMGAKQEFIEQIGTEMITEKGTPYLIKGGYLK